MSAPEEDGRAPQPPGGENDGREGIVEHDESGEFGDLGDLGDPGDLGDELGAVLRDRLHQAVSGLEPMPGTLDYLRRAVPARRRRRHAALAATAVSVFAVSAGVALGARGTFTPGHDDAAGSNVGNLMTTSGNDVPGGGSAHYPETPGGQDISSGGAPSAQEPSSPIPVSGNTKSAPSASLLPPTATGSMAAAACQGSSVSSVAATEISVTSGITYESFVGTVKTACTLSGLPGLTVTGLGGAAARVPVYQADQAAAPLLPSVPSGVTLAFQPGDRFEFQLAWVPLTCQPNPTPTTPGSSGPSSSGSPTATDSSSGSTASGPSTSPSGQPTPSGTPSATVSSGRMFSVGYSVSGSQTAQSVSLAADCGATIYVTDYFVAGQRHVSPQLPSTASTSSSSN